MNSEMDTLLTLDDKGLSQTRCGVTALFRLILMDAKITSKVWRDKMQRYLDSPRSGVSDNRAKKSSERNNLNRALAKDGITWKKFRTALRILNTKHVDHVLTIVEWDETKDVPRRPKSISVESRINQDDLHALWGELYSKMGVKPQMFVKLLSDYIDSPESGVGDNPADKSTKRGNIAKGLKSESYSWSAFVELLKIMGIRKITLTTKITWMNGKVTSHSIHQQICR